MQIKELTVSYLSRQMQTFIESKEFAQFKSERIRQTIECLPYANSNLQTELLQYEQQVERCKIAINELLSCIEFLKRLRIVKKEPAIN